MGGVSSEDEEAQECDSKASKVEVGIAADIDESAGMRGRELGGEGDSELELPEIEEGVDAQGWQKQFDSILRAERASFLAGRLT